MNTIFRSPARRASEKKGKFDEVERPSPVQHSPVPGSPLSVPLIDSEKADNLGKLHGGVSMFLVRLSTSYIVPRTVGNSTTYMFTDSLYPRRQHIEGEQKDWCKSPSSQLHH
mmetsp:Transcript_8880/g.24100  ORF Transcript_8880/g.24100 Transcript_8880/m.24100 type:complete len:112 (-) Transcript_8880:2043-2378(-)